MERMAAAAAAASETGWAPGPRGIVGKWEAGRPCLGWKSSA